jgi:hypothetical protein
MAAIFKMKTDNSTPSKQYLHELQTDVQSGLLLLPFMQKQSPFYPGLCL